MSRIWAGIDAGKSHHHCVVLDAEGTPLLSRGVANDEPALLRLLADVLALGDEIIWCIDIVDGAAGLVRAVLIDRDQQVLYIPGRAVNRAAYGYRGQVSATLGRAAAHRATALITYKSNSAVIRVEPASAHRGWW